MKWERTPPRRDFLGHSAGVLHYPRRSQKKNHRQQGQPPESSEGARRATGEGSGGPAHRGRFSALRKLEPVQRRLRGESEDELSRTLGVTAATLAQWRDTVLMSALASLKSRDSDRRTKSLSA
jgi:hypothetical protein